MHRKIVEKNFEMVIFGHSEFLPNNFSQKDWYKFGMVKNGHSEFFSQFFPKRLVQIWNGQNWLF